MVNTGDQFFSAFQPVLHSKCLKKAFCASLYTVTQSNRIYSRISLHIPGKHGHRIRIIKEYSVRTNLLHIASKRFHDRNRSEGAHDTADSKGITDRLSQTVLFRDLEISNRTGIISPNLNGINDKIGPLQRLFPLLNATIIFYLSKPAACLLNCLKYNPSFIQPFTVNVIESKGTVPQCFHSQTVTDNISGEYCASGSQQCDLHSPPPFFLYIIRKKLIAILIYVTQICYNVGYTGKMIDFSIK